MILISPLLMKRWNLLTKAALAWARVGTPLRRFAPLYCQVPSLLRMTTLPFLEGV